MRACLLTGLPPEFARQAAENHRMGEVTKKLGQK